jgi:hypothetical protein
MCAATDDGMVIVDVWESEEDFRAMKADAEFQQNLRDSGTPEPDTLDVWPSTPPSLRARRPLTLSHWQRRFLSTNPASASAATRMSPVALLTGSRSQLV